MNINSKSDYFNCFSIGQNMELPKGWTQPVEFTNFDGGIRKIGVEIEFASVSCLEAANLVLKLFGGSIEQDSEFRIKVIDTQFGEFLVELDNQYAHPDSDSKQITSKEFEQWLAEVIGKLSQNFVPIEIVSPPIALNSLPELQKLIVGLRKIKAKDTEESIVYGFGLHLNPEASSLKSSSILAHLQSFVLLEDWLRQQIDLDKTRQLLPFSNPFPKEYCDFILENDYKPDLNQLIDDYLSENSSRNRALDMLPMFSYLDPDRVESSIDSNLIKPRPTFHYRLPDCKLSDPSWGIDTEWNRWAAVERLAHNPQARAQLTKDRIENNGQEYLNKLLGTLEKWLNK